MFCLYNWIFFIKIWELSSLEVPINLKKSEREVRNPKVPTKFKAILARRKNEKIKVYLRDNKIYDFETVESGRAGNPIGEITINSLGKKNIAGNINIFKRISQ